MGRGLDRIVKLMKADRDANFVETNDKGVTVNRWSTTSMLMLERGVERIRLSVDQGGPRPGDGLARYPGKDLTRPDGGQSGPDVWARRDDQPLG
jgi:hypothetical protein